MKVRLIRKEEFKSYFIPPLFYGPILGFIIFLVGILDNEFSISAINAFIFGFALTFGIQLIGFIIIEVFVRRNQIQKLQNENFGALEQYGIQLHDDLVYRGNYKGFWINIYPQEENIEKQKKLYFTINTYFNYPDDIVDKDSQWDYDQQNCNKYDVGTINFGGNAVTVVPINKYNPDFKSSIDFLIFKLQELKLSPLNFKTWEDIYVKPIKDKQEKEKQKRTKQILKIGNIIDIKYEKPVASTKNNL